MSELLLELKSGCISCPQQADIQKDLLKFSLIKHFLELGGESLVGESGEEFDKFITTQVPAEDVTMLSQNIRKLVGNSLDDIDSKIDAVQARSKELGDSCGGIFKMRASKDGICYKVGVCTSSVLRQSNDNYDGNALTANILATPQE